MGPPPGLAVRAGPRYPLLLAALGVALLALLPFALSRHNPLWGDEAMFGYLAWAAHATGTPLYQVGYDSKPPGILWLYQAVRGYDAAGVGRARLVVGMLATATCALLVLWLGAAASVGAGIWAGLAAALMFAYLPGQLALAETPLTFCTTLGFYLLDRARRAPAARGFLLAGLALGLASVFKQTAAAELLAALLAIAFIPSETTRRQRLAAAGAMASGFAAVNLAVVAWVAVTGQFSPYWGATVGWLLGGGYPALEESRLVVVRNFWQYRLVMVQVLAVCALVGFLAHERGGERGLTRILGLWLLLAGLAFLAPGWLTDNQLPPLFPPFAGLAGLGLAWIAGQMAGWRPGWRAAGALALAGLALGPLADRYQIRLKQAVRNERAAAGAPVERLGEWIAAQVPSDQKIFVVGVEVQVYLHAHRLAPSPIYRLGLTTTPALQARLLHDLQADPPAVVVFTDLMELRWMQDLAARVRREFVAGRYLRVKHPEGGEYEVYLRRDLVGRLPAEAVSAS